MRIGLLVLSCVFALAASASSSLALQVGDPFPLYKLTDLQDAQHPLGGPSRSILLIHLFGAGSDACQRAAPRLEADFHKRYAERGLKVVGIEVWTGERGDAEAFRDFTQVTYPILMGGVALGQDCGLAYNSFILVDSEGTVRYISEGPDATAYDASSLGISVETHLQEVSTVDLRTWGFIKELYDRR